MKKNICLILIVTLFCVSTLSVSAKDWKVVEELPDNPKVGDVATIEETYTYEEVRELKKKFKNASDTIIDEINSGCSVVSTLLGLIAENLGRSIEIGKLSNGVLYFSGFLLINRLCGVQAVFRAVENQYEYYQDIEDEMETNDTVTISQEFEYRLWRLYGDRFYAWYENGSKSYEIN